jgi:hypothetical protein
MAIGIALFFTGLFLIYFYDITKPTTGGGKEFDRWGFCMNSLGLAILIISLFPLWPGIVKTATHAYLRHFINADEGQYVVANRLKSLEASPDGSSITWTLPENTVALWYGVNFQTEKPDDKPNTQVLSGETTSFDGVPPGWTEAEVFYGTAQGPSSSRKVKNPAAAKASGTPSKTK